MPVHWYYDTVALDRDYGRLDGYAAPKNPHPDSILWRSRYVPRDADADILHDQAHYWGRRGVHYHQFLPAGDNTLNFLLAAQLYRSTVRAGGYDADAWLDLYVRLMRSPGWHRDTYVEEYHRAFFEQRSRGKPLRECGIDDVHIGGLAPVPALLAALDALGDNSVDQDCGVVAEHVSLTHSNAHVLAAAGALTRMLHAITDGASLRDAVAVHGSAWASPSQLDHWSGFEDRTVVGRHLSPACYLPESFAAALFLAWKYADDFSAGVLANARCGGDSCHRGAVVGSLLGAANDVPPSWLRGLRSTERLRCDTLDPVFGEPAPHGAGSFHNPDQHHRLMERVDVLLRGKNGE